MLEVTCGLMVVIYVTVYKPKSMQQSRCREQGAHEAQRWCVSQQVLVRYRGTHKGKVFDETKGKPFTFRLGELHSLLGPVSENLTISKGGVRICAAQAEAPCRLKLACRGAAQEWER